ncbi:PAS domain-containing sensor histidine kinase [Rhodocytophaga aerolata]|uniref:histidine kinase n=1 Tax=Rhodocytophaga aerolata TaxID=455078 RepID=A0ABT8QXZ1_9BACT|nr:PAS domain-containing sensor histidine kinase [Rhodocytophaga aerolata]MDO1444710.1 PAS domain-containing sensor histidine kinase [Rhodocytophaga aerolata]
MNLEINQLLINSAPEGILAFDTDFQVTAWNNKMEQFFQLPAKDVVGCKVTDSCMPVLFQENFNTFFYDVLQGNSSTISTINFQHNQTYEFFEITYFPLLYADGGIVMFKEIQLQAQLHKLSSKTYIQFQDVLESMADAFVALDSSWRYTYVNKKAAAIFNRTQEYLIGKHIWTEFPEGIGQPFYEAYYKAVKEKKHITLKEYYAPYNKWFENRIFPLQDGVAIFFTDITDRVIEEEKLKLLNTKLENQNNELQIQEGMLLDHQEELKRSIHELKERNFELDQIVYKTSHDLRSPLVSILGLLSLIKNETDVEQVRSHLDFIENRVNKLDDFVKSMLNFSKINRIDSKPVFINFQELISQCLQGLHFIKDYDKVEKFIQISGPPFKQDSLRMEIVFNNILSNAIKYMNPYASQPYLRIDIIVTGQQANITFQDNGIGIKQEYLDHVFEMFVRGTERSEGSGLGLYIVKQTIERLNGTITISSVAGEGTSLQLSIPNLA